jgi:glycosyltransferase involved in cell wall biosynthesis
MSHGGVRKGVVQVAWAFHRAFPGGEDVRLQLKIHGDCEIEALPDDPRITLRRESWNEHQMAEWFERLHVYVTMATAEGFGFMPLQAMACGRAVIGVIAHGHAEFMTPDTVLAVPAVMARAEESAGPRWDYAGYWFPADEGAVIEQMRRCYRASGRAEAWSLGQRAAAHASQFTWDRYGEALVRVLEEVEAVPRRVGAGCTR